MFDLIVKGHRTATGRDIAPLVISWAVHALAVGAIGVLTLLFTTDRLPPLPNEVLTYVVAAAPPPPPPPPPPVAARKPSPVDSRPVSTPYPSGIGPIPPISASSSGRHARRRSPVMTRMKFSLIMFLNALLTVLMIVMIITDAKGATLTAAITAL